MTIKNGDIPTIPFQQHDLMTVTKQQQLAWLAKHWNEWVSPARFVSMSTVILGGFTSISSYAHEITKEEWQQQRNK